MAVRPENLPQNVRTALQAGLDIILATYDMQDTDENWKKMCTWTEDLAKGYYGTPEEPLACGIIVAASDYIQKVVTQRTEKGGKK